MEIGCLSFLFYDAVLSAEARIGGTSQYTMDVELELNCFMLVLAY